MEVIIIVLTSLLTFASFYIYKLKKQNEILFLTLSKIESMPPNEYDEVRENFLKFISDSREWAFDYIEEVQANIESITNDMKPSIDKINEKTRKSKEDRDLINTFNSLKKLLPEKVD